MKILLMIVLIIGAIYALFTMPVLDLSILAILIYLGRINDKLDKR